MGLRPVCSKGWLWGPHSPNIASPWARVSFNSCDLVVPAVKGRLDLGRNLTLFEAGRWPPAVAGLAHPDLARFGCTSRGVNVWSIWGSGSRAFRRFAGAEAGLAEPCCRIACTPVYSGACDLSVRTMGAPHAHSAQCDKAVGQGGRYQLLWHSLRIGGEVNFRPLVLVRISTLLFLPITCSIIPRQRF
jgi:hypothetical protein